MVAQEIIDYIEENNLPDSVKYKYLCGPNEMDPALVGVSTNLILFPWCASAGRLYMASNMIPKSVVTFGASERMMYTGFEWQYAETARVVKAPANMVVEEVFYVGSLKGNGELTDAWNEIFVIYKNDEMNMYDLLVLPRYNVQNHYVGFEYKYDKEVMRRLFKGKGATFSKGTVFGKSPRINEETGEWMFGMDAKVAALSHHLTEEDAIGIRRGFAENELRCMFKHDRSYGWNESEFVPLMLYGTDEDPRPFAQSGERIRPDGIVMGFRRRNTDTALVSLTNKALRIPDLVYDVLFYAPPNSEVMAVEVLSERMKDKSNNRSTDYIEQPHTAILDRHERKQNEMWTTVLRWYRKKLAANRNEDFPITPELGHFLSFAGGSYTRDADSGKVNPLARAIKRQKLKDWTVKILLREIVPGRVKFKFAGLNGDKGVCVQIIEDADMPRYDDGTVADVLINNTPAFRRQIYSMLMELSINFVNVNVQRIVKGHRANKDYVNAWAELTKFFDTGFPEYGEIVRQTYITDEDRVELVDYVCEKKITVHIRSNTRLYGVNIINALRRVYNFKPQHVTMVDSFGDRIRSANPVLIANQHFMMLDKFGTDMSAQAFPKSNLFGMPAKLNDSSKHSNWIRDQGNRNTGETEGRLRTSQHGGQEINKKLAMAYSPDAREIMVTRMIRAHDPFNVDQYLKPDEYNTNRALKMGVSMLSDSGYTLRRELPGDRTIPAFNMDDVTDEGLREFLEMSEAPEGDDLLIPRERLNAPVKTINQPNPASLRDDDLFEKEFLTKGSE